MSILKNLLTKFRKTRDTENGGPLINILTRTSGRPVGFGKCHSSITGQTYPNTRHIVSYDTTEDLNYLDLPDIERVKVKKKSYKGKLAKQGHKLNFEPYNLYCNQLLKMVRKGWVMFLDDDDMLANHTVLNEIVKVIEDLDTDTLLIWKTEYPDGRQLPDSNAFEKEEIEYMNIDTGCFIFHSKYAGAARWDAWRGADYRYIRDLATNIPNQLWIPKTITLKNNFGDQGNRNDLVE